MIEEVINCWPLVLSLEDCYVPELAPQVLQATRAADPELFATSFACDAFAAEVDLLTRLN